MRGRAIRAALTAAAGVAGPAAFVAAWVVGGLRADALSPVDDPISALAELGAPPRPLMTAGFVAFGVLVPAFALGARHRLGRPAAVALAVSGAATLAVAALPLDPARSVPEHAVAAGVGYLGLAAAPALAARASDPPLPAALGLVVSAVAAAALVASVVGEPTGLWQRAGLTLLDAWVVAAALRTLRTGGRDRPGR